jgi:hypothetical protein
MPALLAYCHIQSMKPLLASLLAALLAAAVFPETRAASPNTLDATERRLGFELLFDGRSFDGWTQGGNWVVEGGALFCRERGGDVYYVKQFVPDDFELRFEWKVAKGVNSGVLYRPGQVEYQILDDANSNYGKNPRTRAAALFFCMAPSRDVTRPHGEWNEGRIVCKGSVIQHWLNGVKVIDFDYTDPKWAHNVALLKIRGWAPPYGGDLAARRGFLHLQYHGGHVWFRSLRMRVIPPDESLPRSVVEEMPMTPEALKIEQARIRGIQSRLNDAAGGMEEMLKKLNSGAKPAKTS